MNFGKNEESFKYFRWLDAGSAWAKPCFSKKCYYKRNTQVTSSIAKWQFYAVFEHAGSTVAANGRVGRLGFSPEINGTYMGAIYFWQGRPLHPIAHERHLLLKDLHTGISKKLPVID